MNGSRVNQLQMRNRQLLVRALKEPKLIGAISFQGGRTIHVEQVEWEQYWDGCGVPATALSPLHTAWTQYVSSGHAPALSPPFVSAYFALLKGTLHRVVHGDAGPNALRKVIGFETFCILDEDGHSVGGIFNVRNPAYLLYRLAQPDASDDPKFLPLICPCGPGPNVARLFGHYRRIAVAHRGRTQLFVYPSVGADDGATGYVLIGRLFKSLTTRNDPWVNKRSGALFSSVFGRILAHHESERVRLLDVACGSARVTPDLCRRAYAHFQKTFDLTLLDVARSYRSIAGVFYRNPAIFHSSAFRQTSLFDWVDSNSSNPALRFDIVLMLRVLDVFSRFAVESLSPSEVEMLIRRDRRPIAFHRRMLDPAGLIDSNMCHKIQHSVQKIRLRGGLTFYQFSLSDYFQAISIAAGGRTGEEQDAVYVPVRRFNDSALVLPSGRSLIGQLMQMADRLVLEDLDLTVRHLRDHVERFNLMGLRARDVTDRRLMRGASVILIDDEGGHDDEPF